MIAVCLARPSVLHSRALPVLPNHLPSIHGGPLFVSAARHPRVQCSVSDDAEELLAAFLDRGGQIVDAADDDDGIDDEEFDDDDEDADWPDDDELDEDAANALLQSFLVEGNAIIDVDQDDDDNDDDNDVDDEQTRARAWREEGTLRDATGLDLTPASRAQEVLRKEGVVRLAAVLKPETAASLREHVLGELSQLRPCEADEVNAESRFSSVLAPLGTASAGGEEGSEAPQPMAPGGGRQQCRWDLRLSLAPVVRRALREVVCGSVGDALLDACGADAELHELAALVAADGAEPQPLHADTLWSEEVCLMTSFVALQPVSRYMGPTRFLRGSHTAEAHEALEKQDEDGEDGDGFLSASRPACGLLDAGDATLYDGRLLHGGSARQRSTGDATQEQMRVLFYTTFRRRGADVDELCNDEAYSLLGRYRGRFSLGELRAMDEGEWGRMEQHQDQEE